MGLGLKVQENSRKRKKKNHRLSDQQRPSKRLLPVQASSDSRFLKLENKKGQNRKESKIKREDLGW